jgi:hypothetical protein
MAMIRPPSEEELLDLRLASDPQRLGPMLRKLPSMVQAATEHSEEFWADQRRAVAARIAEADPGPAALPILALATTAALIIAAGLMLNRPPVQPRHAPPHRETDVDHELLLQVERTLDNGGPEALEPAALLAKEIVKAQTNSISPRSHREPNHEN